jgi:thiol-disulfide isomerase/thioredoxin
MKKFCFIILTGLLGLTARSQKLAAWKITEVVNYYSQKNDSVYVVNFWATFCRPCIAEIPFLQSITKKYADKKVKLLLVSLDMPDFYPGKIESFANQTGITADMVWLNETDADYFCNMIDKKWGGSIPATIIVNAATGYKKFFEQEFKPEEFEAELAKAMAR